MSNSTALIIFIKNPVLGKVKTRLAKSIGDQKALDIYQHLIKITQTVSLQSTCNRYLFYSDFVDRTDNWPENKFLKHLQIGDDLGQRMQHAFEFVFKLGHSKALIIGSDCPTITAQHLQEAETSLDKNEVAFGPSEDGGYYLLGMKKLIPQLFENQPWSTNVILQNAIDELKQLQLNYQLLTTLNDIDTLEDWEQYKNIEVKE